MTRLSHKQIKELGLSLRGFKIPETNIYKYENVVADIRAFVSRNEAESARIIDIIRSRWPEAAHGVDYQMAYSCGAYGTTGALHRIRIEDAEFQELGTIYTYF